MMVGRLLAGGEIWLLRSTSFCANHAVGGDVRSTRRLRPMTSCVEMVIPSRATPSKMHRTDEVVPIVRLRVLRALRGSKCLLLNAGADILRRVVRGKLFWDLNAREQIVARELPASPVVGGKSIAATP
jgi:hypothetical protein